MVTCVAPVVMLCIAKKETRSQFPILSFPFHTTGSREFYWGSMLGPPRHWGRPSTGEVDQKDETSVICWATVHIPMLSSVPSAWWHVSSVFSWRALPVGALFLQAEYFAEQSCSLIEKSHCSYQILQNGSIDIGDNPIPCYLYGHLK